MSDKPKRERPDPAIFNPPEEAAGIFERAPFADPVSGKVIQRIVVTERARRQWSRGNPRKFQPDRALQILTFIGAGAFIETAAAAAGISKVTLYAWLRAGESKKHPGSTKELRAWKQLLDEAEATAEARALQGITKAGGSGIWQAHAWFLERKYPQRWRQRNTVIPETPDGQPAPAVPRLEVCYVAPRTDDALNAPPEVKPEDGSDDDEA